jgi:hypothetical protein
MAGQFGTFQPWRLWKSTGEDAGMPSGQLKPAERAIAAIRDQGELPPETAEALDEIVSAIRVVEGRLAALEGKGKPTVQMDLPNRRA